MNYLERAQELKDTLLEDRQTIHQFAETGFDLPKTSSYVAKKLREYGCQPQQVGRCGVSCTVGHGGKTILLRADMDALPMAEESGLPFAAKNGHCHSCGHDIHTAMLLCAAKMLKERENELKGTVKFMFQPAEELLSGAKDMIAAGILENPTVDAAVGMHIFSGLPFSRSGHILYHCGPVMNSGDTVRVRITGLAAHGSMPFQGVDAINIAAHLTLALQEIISREIPAQKEAVVLVGTISGGASPNTVAGEAELGVTLRAESMELRNFLLKRVKEISEATAAVYRGSASVNVEVSVPPLYNEPELTKEIAGYAANLLPQGTVEEIPKLNGGEDFTYVAQKVPAAFLILGGGSIDEGYKYSQHNPKIRFNETAFPAGAAMLAHCAEAWLEHNQ